MTKPFHSARLKTDRAKKHVDELQRFMATEAAADLYSVAIEKEDAWYGDVELAVTIHKPKEEFRDKAALIIGDVYHNLRSALDVLWFEIVSPTRLQTKWTRFPIRDTREELKDIVESSFKKGQIGKIVRDFVIDTIKPYREGNFVLWSIEEANIIDKHQLLIPNISIIGILGIRLQNDDEIIEILPIWTESSCRFRPKRLELDSFGKNPKVIDNGHAAIGYAFDLGHPQPGDPVILTLLAITVEISRLIEAFGVLLS